MCTKECCALVVASSEGKCGNTIADLPVPYLVVRDCDDYSMGKELTAGPRGFRKGNFVGQYIGDLIASNVALSEDLRYTIFCDMKSSSVKWPPFVYINAEKKGNMSRLANHSHNPNCDLFIWFENECPIAILLATREILPGEAITIDYNWERQGCFGSSGCLCKSELCPNTDRSKSTSLVEMLLLTSREKSFNMSTCPLCVVPAAKKTKRRPQVQAAPEASLTEEGNNQRNLLIVQMISYFV